jgi:hypothetical protein
MLKQLFEKIFGTKPQPVVEAPAPAVVVAETNTYTVPVTAPASTIVIPEVVVEAPVAVVVPAKKPAPKKKESWEFADKKAPAKPATSKRSRIAKPAAPKRSKPQA